MKRYSYRERDYGFGQAMLSLRTSIGLTQVGLLSESVRSAGKHKSDRNDSSTKGKNKTMEQQHESDLVKRLEQLGIEVDVSPTVTSLTYEQIYTSGPTLEEALITFLGEALSRYDALRKWKANTMPIVTDWSDKH